MEPDHSYEYDQARAAIVLEGTNQPVARDVDPAHGLLLAASPLFKIGCVKIEEILGMEHLSYEDRVGRSRELLGMLLVSYQREQIRMLPES